LIDSGVLPARNDDDEAGEVFSPRLRVLVVDDEPDAVTTLCALLRHEGYEARGHASGEAAIAALHDFMPDVVISDIAMPNVNGWELARAIRQKMGKHPLLIALTARFKQPSAKVLAQISGFDHYVTKPADPNLLLELIQKGRET
jgi:CheY-like chemotaxis protein